MDFYVVKNSENNLNSEIGPFLSFGRLIIRITATVHAVNANDNGLYTTPANLDAWTHMSFTHFNNVITK
ncbi:hypothetical protein FQA39_LY09515, partial [Lamprigera yunnana]